MMRTLSLLALTLAGACSQANPLEAVANAAPAAPTPKRPAPQPPRTPAPQPPPKAPPAPAPKVPPAETAPDVKAHMRAHFAAVAELELALVRGQLEQARALARWLLEHEEKPAEGWQPHLDELRAAAREVVAAADVPTAARPTGRLGRACSRCHEARAAVVSFGWSPPPDDEPALRAQMDRHQWAAARLWEGLVGPSDEMWSQGTTVLASTRLDAQVAPERADVSTLVARLREQATRAGQTSSGDARGKLFGELLSTCTSCHQLVRPQPVQ